MSISALNTNYQGKVQLEDLHSVTERLGFTLSPQDEPDMLILLQSLDDQMKILADLPDYQEEPDVSFYPRKDLGRTPKGPENPDGAWAHRCNIQGDDYAMKNGILKGGTVCIKDNISVAGIPCLVGTESFTGWIPKTDATIVTRILKAGGVITGKAVCENMCMTPASNSAATGPVENPYAFGFSAGGSSSGTGNIVAKGEAKYGIGADQGGSVRIPSANCGLVGLKPTFGLVPYTGCVSGEANLDYAGPMTKSVLENAELLEAIAGVDRIDDRQGASCPITAPPYSLNLKQSDISDLSGVRIGLIKEAWDVSLLVPSMASKVKEAALKFKALGAIVEEVSIPFHVYGPLLAQTISRQGGCLTRLGKQTGRRQLYLNDLTDISSPMTQEMSDKTYFTVLNTIINGTHTWDKYPSAYGKAMNLSRRLRNEYDAALAKYDVLILPTLNYAPKRHAAADAPPLIQAKQFLGQTMHLAPFNLTGHPALTIPIGFLSPAEDDIREESEKLLKLPVGMQLVGKWFGEDTIYRVAGAWEKAYDWTTM